MREFRSRAWQTNAPLAKDEARRQGLITNLAFTALGGTQEALRFLNGQNVELNGRPLDIAMATPEGYLKVEAEIKALAAA